MGSRPRLWGRRDFGQLDCGLLPNFNNLATLLTCLKTGRMTAFVSCSVGLSDAASSQISEIIILH